MVPGDPAVSVVVRTKDRLSLLGEALGSLAAQEFRDFEVVLVNDSDVPLSPSVAEGMPLPSVRIVEAGPPHGRSRALNLGVAAARGRWIGYLDDDDVFLPSHLATLWSVVVAEPGVRAAYSDALLVRQARRADGALEETSRRPIFGRPFAPWRILWQNTVPLLCLIHEKGAWEDAGRYDETFDLFEDWEFLVRLFHVAPPRHVPAATSLYRLRDDDSNATEASPWDAPRTREARRRVLEKHRALRTPEVEAAFVDAAEAELSAALSREAELREAHAVACREWDAAAQRLSELTDEIRGGEAEKAGLRERLDHAEERIAETEGRLAGTQAHLARSEAARLEAEAEAVRLTGIVERMTHSVVWRLFTPWWKLKELLDRGVRPGERPPR